MRHRKINIKLGRSSGHRRALFRNLLCALFQHERITTTDVKAKLLKRISEKIITLGKKNTLHARRMVAKDIHDKDLLHKIFGEIAPRFAERHGGYTRIIKHKRRLGDGAPLSIIELLPVEQPAAPKEEKPEKSEKTEKSE